MRTIEKEWVWELTESERGMWQRELLIWNGIVLASVEGATDRWFGNIGRGVVIVDWKNRAAHIRTRRACRNIMEKRVLELLSNSMAEVKEKSDDQVDD